MIIGTSNIRHQSIFEYLASINMPCRYFIFWTLFSSW